MNRPLRGTTAAPLLWLAAIAAFLWAAAPDPARASSPVTSPHGSLEAECALCHGARGWKPAQINPKFKHADYGFALEGAHRAVECTACHRSLEFARAETACASCHLDPHRGEFGVACEQCHTARSFLDRSAMTRRHQETRFPLIGAHLATDCQRCHELKPSGALRFAAMPTMCRSCHLDDYKSATNPDHASSGFSLECESCHRFVSWHSAAFDHAGTGFPLTGTHRSVPCAACHVGGVYKGTSTACVSCHQNDYDATTNPNHAQMGFPLDCASCHGTSNWRGSFTQHDALYFPIYSGAHRGRWTLCADCHTDPANFTTFSCIGCHPHSDQATTDAKHAAVTGYQYASTACYSCHPRGTH